MKKLLTIIFAFVCITAYSQITEGEVVIDGKFSYSDNLSMAIFGENQYNKSKKGTTFTITQTKENIVSVLIMCKKKILFEQTFPDYIYLTQIDTKEKRCFHIRSKHRIDLVFMNISNDWCVMFIP